MSGARLIREARSRGKSGRFNHRPLLPRGNPEESAGRAGMKRSARLREKARPSQIPEPPISSGSGGGVGAIGRPVPVARGNGLGIGIHQVSSTSA